MKTKIIYFEILIYSLEVACVLFLFYKPAILAILLFVLSSIYLVIIKSKRLTIIYLLAMIVGPFAELAAILRGAWVYLHPTIFGLPVWLPFAWGIVTMFIFRISEVINELLVKSDSKVHEKL